MRSHLVDKLSAWEAVTVKGAAPDPAQCRQNLLIPKHFDIRVCAPCVQGEIIHPSIVLL